MDLTVNAAIFASFENGRSILRLEKPLIISTIFTIVTEKFLRAYSPANIKRIHVDSINLQVIITIRDHLINVALHFVWVVVSPLLNCSPASAPT